VTPRRKPTSRIRSGGSPAGKAGARTVDAASSRSATSSPPAGSSPSTSEGIPGIRYTAAATTTLTLVILGQLLPAGLRQYLPGTAAQAAITVHRSAGLLTPDAAIAVLGAYAAIALAAALIRVAHRDA